MDDSAEKKGKTRILKYKPIASDMPHKHFKDYIVIYGRKTCPYCNNAVNYLKSAPKVLFVEIDKEPMDLFGKSNLLKILKPVIGTHSTVPMIFNKTVFIGGSDALSKIKL
jgi:glutaredoxin